MEIIAALVAASNNSLTPSCKYSWVDQGDGARNVYLCFGGALVIPDTSDPLHHELALLPGDGALLGLLQPPHLILALPQVLLQADQQHGHRGAEVLDLGHPALGDVLEAVWAGHGEAEEDDVSVGVGERPQPVVVLLARRVPQRQLHLHHTTGSALE